MTSRMTTVCVGIVVSADLLDAQVRSRYRDFQLDRLVNRAGFKP